MIKEPPRWMLVSKTGRHVISSPPALTANMAWKHAREWLGATAVLQLKRQGYIAQKVTIKIEERTWRIKG